METANKTIVCIGAGPSGLVTAKYAKELGFRVKVLEAEDELGGTFKWRTYDHGELVSSRQLTAFSDFRISDDYYDTECTSKDHVLLKDYCRYLKDYAKRYGVLEDIEFNACVQSVQRHPSDASRYVVTWSRTSRGVESQGSKSRSGEEEPASTEIFTIECDAVAVCSGLHTYPNFPEIPGQNNLEKNGTVIMHSADYKSAECLRDRKVLICGLGETASDVGFDAIRANAKEARICHRHGFLSFPKRFSDFEILGHRFDAELPIDTLISSLHETAYVHQKLKDSRFRWHFSDVFVRGLLYGLTGTSIGANQWVAPARKIGRAYNVLNKSTRVMPYLNAPFKKHYWWERFARVVEPDTGGKAVYLQPWISHVDERGYVHFIDNGTPESELAKKLGPFKPDIVILATGYRQEYPFLEPSLPRPSQANIRDIIRLDVPTLAFIGFVRPNVGAIPPLSEMQAMWWLQVLVGNLNPASCIDPAPHWHLLGRSEKRVNYAIDHSSYVYQLAKDIGSAPSVYPPSPIFLKHPKLLLIYAMAASFNTCFRLVGPYAWNGAGKVMRTELWETVTRRGVLGNLFMGLIPMVFYGTVNLAVWVIDTVFGYCGLSLF